LVKYRDVDVGERFRGNPALKALHVADKCGQTFGLCCEPKVWQFT